MFILNLTIKYTLFPSRISILFCFFLIVNIGLSQTFNFQYYNVQEGLPQSKVNALIQDSRGFIWVGTSGGGICKYDGKSFTQYSSNEGLSGDIITSIAEDKEHNIWIASTWGGVSKFDGRKFTIYNKTDKNEEISGVEQVYCTSEGTIFILVNQELYIFKSGVFRKVNSTLQTMIKSHIMEIYEDSKKDIWISTIDGIIYISKTDTFTINTENGLPAKMVTTIYEDVNGDYLIGSHGGGTAKLLKGSIDRKKEFIFQQVDINPNAIVTSITTDFDKNTILGTFTDGIYCIDQNNKITQIKTENGLPSNSITKLLTDRTGNTWIGTSGQGLVKFSNRTFTFFDNIEGLNSSDIFGIYVDKKDIWVGTGSNGVYKYDGKTTIHFDNTNGLPNNEIRAILKDNDGSFWFATRGGLVKYANNKFKTYTTSDGLPSSRIQSLMIDKNNNLWIGTFGSGLSVLKDGKFTNYSENDGLTSSHIHSILEDKKGNIWIGTGNGINKFAGGKFTNYLQSSGICNSYIGSIAEDEFGNLWFGTDRCVVKYNGIDFKSITTNDGLSSNTVYLVLSDKNKGVWVGTNKGVNKISLNSYGQIEKIKNYSYQDGFKGIECNSRAVFEDDENNIWFGTIKGLIKYQPKEDRMNVFQPIVRLENIKLFLQDVNWGSKTKNFVEWTNLPKNLELDYNENHITFEYSAINLNNPENVEFSFKLEPFDAEWYQNTKKTFITYSNLPPGEYTFLLKAKNNDGVWSNKPIEYKFTISTPFWQTWWFYTLLLTTIVYLLIKISKIQEDKQRKISQELEKKVHERTILIEQQHHEKEILLKEIHHRVKNNMQVINSLLSLQSNYTTDEKALVLFEEAKSRIRTMALIHEKMYQSGDLAKIDFQDYIVSLTNDLIATYSINCSIFLDIKIENQIKFDIDSIIPLGLLINEIVSNTLKYGFDKKENGTITIHLNQKENDGFVLKIGDNGKGMPREIFENNTNTLGMELIQVFTEQLDGKIKLLDVPGTVYEITFNKRKPNKSV